MIISFILGDRHHRLPQKRRRAGEGASMANHANTRTTQLYDRRRDEVERISI
jgi:hypothetical protein